MVGHGRPALSSWNTLNRSAPPSRHCSTCLPNRPPSNEPVWYFWGYIPIGGIDALGVIGTLVRTVLAFLTIPLTGTGAYL